MPRREARLRREAREAERAAEVAKEARLKILRDRAAAARAVKAVKDKERKEAIAAGKPVPPRIHRKPDPGEHSLLGRIDLMLVRLGKTRRELSDATGMKPHSIAGLGRRPGAKLRPDNLNNVAAFLGVTPDWLEGDAAPSVDIDKVGAAQGGPLIVPQAAIVFRSKNGAAHLPVHHRSREGKIDASMRNSVTSAMNSLWTMMPLDIQMFLVARMAELLANNKTA